MTTRRTGSPHVMTLTPQQRFVASSSPAEWASTAQELRYSARLLWRQEHFSLAFTSPFGRRPEGKSMVSRSSLLLYALAIENLLKAISVSKAPLLISRGRLDRALTHHDLTRLSGTAGSTLTADEQSLCEALTTVIISSGRYPTSKDMNSLADERASSQSIVDQAEALFTKLSDELTATLTGEWDGGNGVKITQFDQRVNDEFFVVYEITSRSGGVEEKQLAAWSFGPPQP